MDAEKLRAAVFRKPFKPVRITLHAGDPIDVLHPETAHIGDVWCAVFQDPMPPIIFEAEMVVSIQFIRDGRSK